MTNKILKWFRIGCMAICAGIVFVQMIYAILWAVHNGNNIQDFYETTVYISNAKSFTSDGWHLIGYSLYIRLFMIFESILADNYVILIYISQLVISLLCYARGCKTLMKLMFAKDIRFKWMLIPAAYIVTIPVVWQMQFAILPDAICVASIVLIFSLLGECLWKYQTFMWKKLLGVGGVLLYIGFMHRHYFYAGSLLVIVTLFVALLRMIRKKYRDKRVLFTVLAMTLCVLFTSVASILGNSILPKSGLYVEYSLSVDLWKRFVYPDLYENYSYYTENVAAVLPEHIAKDCDEHFEYYISNMGPTITNMYPEDAEKVFRELTRSGFALHKAAMVKSLAKESIAYAFMPLAMEKYMYNNGDSLYGYNFTRMYETCPNTASDYMHIGMNGFFAISMIGMVKYLLDLIINEGRKKRNILGLLYCIGTVLCVTAPVMFFAFAKFDYRIGMFSAVVWGMIAVLSISNSFYERQKLA